MTDKKAVAVIGASSDKSKASNQAVERLLEKGYKVYPINPKLKTLHGQKVYPDLKALPEPIHTLSVYLGEKRSTPLLNDILTLNPHRILLNPGAENPFLTKEAKSQNIHVEEACTLVLLGIGTF